LDAFATQWPVVTLTFNPNNLIRSSVGASEYFLQVSTRFLKPFLSHRGTISVQTNKWTDGQPKTWCYRLAKP